MFSLSFLGEIFGEFNGITSGIGTDSVDFRAMNRFVSIMQEFEEEEEEEEEVGEDDSQTSSGSDGHFEENDDDDDEVGDDEGGEGSERESDFHHLKRSYNGQLYHGKIVLWCYNLNQMCLEYLLQQTGTGHRPRCLRGIAFRECTFERDEDTLRSLSELLEQTRLSSLEITGGVVTALANEDPWRISNHTQRQTVETLLQAVQLAQNNNIEELSLNFADLSGQDLGRQMASTLHSPACKVRKLSLVCPSIDEETMLGFTQINHDKNESLNTTIEELCIELDHGGGEAMRSLVPCILRLSKLRKLHFMDTELGPEALTHFTELVARHKSLESLDIVQTINLFRTNVYALDTCSPEIEAFANALGQNQSLQYLGLCGSGIAAKALASVLRGLHKNNSLISLDLRLNFIDYSVGEWAQQLSKVRKLSTLRLPSANETEQLKLAQYLQGNTSITNLQCGTSALRPDIKLLLERNKLLLLARRCCNLSTNALPTILWPNLIENLANDNGEMSPVYEFILAKHPEISGPR